MKVKLLIILGIVFTIGFVLAKLPASLVLQHEQLKFAGVNSAEVKGSLWQGQAQNLKVKNISLDEVDWKINPAALAALDSLAKVNIKHGESVLSADVESVANAIVLHNVRGRIAIADVINMAQKYKNFIMPLAVNGMVKLELDDITIIKNKRLKSANGQLDLSKLEIGGQELRGTYSADIKTLNKVISARIASSSNSDVELSGNASLAPNGAYKLNGKLGPSDASPESILALLKLIGINSKNQSRSFKHQGKLRY